MYETVKMLCSCGGVSGNEREISDTVRNLFFPYADVKTNKSGSVFAEFGNKNAEKTILLDAHLDKIGFIVTDITSKGFLKIEKCGGIDYRTVLGCGVTVHGKEPVKGVVCCLPPHLSDGKEDRAPGSDMLFVDTGLNLQKVKELVSLGDTVSFAEEPARLINNRITSPALDNRAGVAALIKTARLLQGEECSFKVIALLSSQEETYQLGAKTGAFEIAPDEAIVVDVSFASQSDISGQYGNIALSKGPMLCQSPVLNREMYLTLKKIAREMNIPYQEEVCCSVTGTNADSIATAKTGVKTALVSIPEKYMHTRGEIADLQDIENTALLISEYILRGGVFNG